MHSIAAHLEEFDPHFYLRALVAVAVADGLHPDEEAFVRSQAEMLGVDAEGLFAAPADVSAVVGPNPLSCRLAYRDCFVLACIDGPPNERERAILGALQRALGLTPELAARIEDWMTRYSELLAEGEALLAAE